MLLLCGHSGKVNFLRAGRAHDEDHQQSVVRDGHCGDLKPHAGSQRTWCDGDMKQEKLSLTVASKEPAQNFKALSEGTRVTSDAG